MIKQECIGIPDMILLLMIFCFKKIKIKAEIVLSPGGAYFYYIIIRSRKNMESCRFFSPDLPREVSNFSKTVHTIFIKFWTVILHQKGPLRAQRHQNRMTGM